MKVKKKFCNTLLCRLLMVFGLVLAMGLLCPQMNAEAKTKTVTVKKIDQKTAKKVHNQLMKGKAFTIRFKCSEKNFYKKFQKLTKKVAKCTDVGFDVFPICAQDSGYYGSAGFDKQDNKPKKSGKYTKFLVKKDYCQEYIYGIKFAEREYSAMKAYVDKIIAESDSTYQRLTSDEVKTWPLNPLVVEMLTKEAEHTLSEYKELQKYLRETKFRDLSGTMKARVVLEVGGTSTNHWIKASMKHKEMGCRNSFKDLYKRRAYGRSIYIAHVICKMCAVYNIGEFEGVRGPSSLKRVVVRVKTRACSGKVRYIVLWDGSFDSSNNYVGCKTDETIVRFRKRNRNAKKIKNIAASQQMKQQIATEAIGYEFDTNTGEAVELIVREVNIDRSEW